MTPPTQDRADPGIQTVNAVHLVGRVSWGPETRVMPSGDEVVLLRVVVPRPRTRLRSSRDPADTPGTPGTTGSTGTAGSTDTPKPSRTQVDAIDVACWTARTRAAALRLAVDDMAEVEGGLHRRFYAGGSGRVSRYEVAAKRLRRATPGRY